MTTAPPLSKCVFEFVCWLWVSLLFSSSQSSIPPPAPQTFSPQLSNNPATFPEIKSSYPVCCLLSEAQLSGASGDRLERQRRGFSRLPGLALLPFKVPACWRGEQGRLLSSSQAAHLLQVCSLLLAGGPRCFAFLLPVLAGAAVTLHAPQKCRTASCTQAAGCRAIISFRRCRVKRLLAAPGSGIQRRAGVTHPTPRLIFPH